MANARRRQDLGPAVDADDREPPTPPPRPLEEGDRDVRAAGPHVDQRQLVAMRRERLDPRRAQTDAAQPAVDPAQVAQVAGQRDRVVEGPVEQLDGVGAAVHVRAGYDALVP